MIARAQCQTLAWVSTTPLGAAVLPEVNWTIAGASAGTSRSGAAPASSHTRSAQTRSALSSTIGPSAAIAGPTRPAIRWDTTRCDIRAVSAIRWVRRA